MSETGTGFNTYTRLYKEQWKELMEPHNKRHTPLRSYLNGSVTTTWMISYTAVRAGNETAANLLLLWAHLDNKSMWHGLLAAAAQESAIAAKKALAWLREIARNEMEFNNAVGMLRNYSLVEEMEDQMGYATHPVVHQWARHIQDDSQQATLLWLAIVLVGLAVPMNDTKKYWETQVRLLPHADRCEKRIKEAVKDLLGERGLNGQAEENETLLWAVSNLGTLYADQGKLDEAEKMFIWALDGHKKALGAEHTSILRTVGDLGNLYRRQGKLDEAEKMFIWALEGYKKALGAEHTSTLNTVVNLGNLYRDQGKLDEAETMYVQALEGHKKALGAEHTSTFLTVNNLGLLYADQGKLDEAEKMYMQALEGYKKALGAEHTSTLRIVGNLGTLYSDQGKLDEAEKMYMQALEGQKKVLGAEHTSTLDTVYNLGVLYAGQGKLEEAEKMYMWALEGYKKALGAEHTSTLDTVNNLNLLYKDQGKLDEAAISRDTLATLAQKEDKFSATTERGLELAHSRTQTVLDSSARHKSSSSRRRKILERFGWKRT
jgi:tetratricopeptide (TPR) repeat protein